MTWRPRCRVVCSEFGPVTETGPTPLAESESHRTNDRRFRQRGAHLDVIAVRHTAGSFSPNLPNFGPIPPQGETGWGDTGQGGERRGGGVSSAARQLCQRARYTPACRPNTLCAADIRVHNPNKLPHCLGFACECVATQQRVTHATNTLRSAHPNRRPTSLLLPASLPGAPEHRATPVSHLNRE